MIKIKFILFLILSIGQYYSTAQVFHTINTANDEGLVYTFEDEFGNYISCGSQYTTIDDGTGNNRNGFIYKLNSNGDLIAKKTITSAENSLYFANCIEIQNGYIFFGTKKYSDGFRYIYLYKTDYDLNFVSEKKLGRSNVEYQNPVQVYLSDNDTLIFGARELVTTSPWEEYAAIYKITTSLDSITSHTFTNTPTGFSDLVSIIPLPNKSGYKIASFGDYTGTLPIEHGIVITNFDNAFNIISSKKISHFILNNSTNNVVNFSASLQWLNDSVYAIGFAAFYDRNPITNGQGPFDIATVYMNNKNDTILFYNILGTTEYPESGTRISVLNNSTLFSAGRHKYNNSYPFYFKENTWVILNKQKYSSTSVDTEWEYLYGGDARYSVGSVLATKDGGCLVTAFKYDTSGVYKSDVFFLKIQSDGTLYPVGGIDKKLKKETICVFPNPSSDFITATFPNNTYSEIGLINHNGNTIFKSILKQNLTELKIDCSVFSSGNYLLYLKDKESGLSIAKKIIIQH